ncbi:hypothetical protein NIES2104_35250 [Leptolyngbya sp. NIES-2104]|nr:hypothetical protein NIES2104_35250 [Leptolyngbya sp. NIES-2104]
MISGISCFGKYLTTFLPKKSGCECLDVWRAKIKVTKSDLILAID